MIEQMVRIIIHSSPLGVVLFVGRDADGNEIVVASIYTFVPHMITVSAGNDHAISFK
jgi:hypothetical protein